MSFFSYLLELSLDAAPYLLFGLILAGLIKAWLPESWVRQQLNGKGSLPVVKAALLGAPMPLCSCSVIPVALGIRRNGASKGATTSFLISTPETGVDSISLTYAMMGPVMAIVRPFAAIMTALTAGFWVNQSPQKSCCASALPEEAAGSCCASKAPTKPTTSSCCSSAREETEPKKTCCSSGSPAPNGVISGISYAFGKLYEDILLWLVAGLVIAAAVQAFVPSEWLAQWGSGWLAKFMMLVIGIPMYICASASTPMAAGLMLAGVSPGTVLVFLLAGPATNMSTIAILRNELGTQVMLKYIVVVMLGALLSGVLLDALLMDSTLNLIEQHHSHAALVPLWFSSATLVMLVLAAIKPLRLAFFKKLGA